MEFTITSSEGYIPLIQLLKACKVVYSGGEAQQMVTDGIVLRNGTVELRKRAKIKAGELIEIPELNVQIRTL